MFREGLENGDGGGEEYSFVRGEGKKAFYCIRVVNYD